MVNRKIMALELLKAIKEELKKNNTLTPKEVATQLAMELRKSIKEYEQVFVELRNKEQEALNKSLFGLPPSTPSNSEVKKAQWMAPLCKACNKPFVNPVDVILARPSGVCKGCSGMAKDEDFKFNPSMENKDVKAASVQKPNKAQVGKFNASLVSPAKKNEDLIVPAHSNEPDKRLKPLGKNPKSKKPEAGKEIEAEGSGGEMKKEALHEANPVPGKQPKAPSLKPEGVPGAKLSDTPSVPKPPSAPGSVGAKFGKAEKTVFDVLKKAAPHLGGKDSMSQGMTQAAFETANVNKNPVAVKTKPPTMEQHAARHQSLQDFMPKGKFDKSELCEACGGDKKNSDKKCAKCGK